MKPPIAHILCATLLSAPLSIPLLPGSGAAFAAPLAQQPQPSRTPDPQWRRYNGNPRWDGRTVYTRDEDLGVPFHVGAPTYGPWVEIDGQRVRAVRRRVEKAGMSPYQGEQMWGYNSAGNESQLPHLPPFEGLEDARGRVILPTVFKAVHVIPGRGVFVQSRLTPDVYDRLDLATGTRAPAPEVITIDHLGPAGAADQYAMILSNGAGAPARIELLSATGEVVRRWPAIDLQRDRWRGDMKPILWLPATPVAPAVVAAYGRVKLVLPGGETAWQIVDAAYRPLSSPLPVEPREMGLRNEPASTAWAIPAPVGEDLWLLARDDRWWAPDGALGLRPADEDMQRPALSLVAYPSPDGTGAAVVYRLIDPMTGALGETLYTDLRSGSLRPGDASEEATFYALKDTTGAWRRARWEMPLMTERRLYIDDRSDRDFTVLTERLRREDAAARDLQARSNAAQAAYAAETARQARLEAEAAWRRTEHGARASGPAFYGPWLQAIHGANDPNALQPGAGRLQTLLDMGPDDPTRQWAERRLTEIRALVARQNQVVRQQAATGVYAGPTAPSVDAWAAYRAQSAQHQQTVQAMRDYTYGRSTQNPYDSWLK